MGNTEIIPDNELEQLGKYGFLRRDYLKNHRNSLYQVMLLQDTKYDEVVECDLIVV